MSLWKFLLNDSSDVNRILESNASTYIGNFCIISYIFLMKFIVQNMV